RHGTGHGAENAARNNRGMGGSAACAPGKREGEFQQHRSRADALENDAEHDEHQYERYDHGYGAAEHAVERIPDDLHDLIKPVAAMFENPRQILAIETVADREQAHDDKRRSEGPLGQDNQGP